MNSNEDFITELTTAERTALANLLFDAEDSVYRVYYEGKRFWWPNGCKESARSLAFEMYALANYAAFGRNWEKALGLDG